MDVDPSWIDLLTDPIDEGYTVTKRTAAELESNRVGHDRDVAQILSKRSQVMINERRLSLEDVKVTLTNNELAAGKLSSTTLCNAAQKFGRYGIYL
jgi:hypothetical protein